MKPYADTNFLTRLYLSLPGTSEAVAQMGGLHVAPALILKCDAFLSFDPKASKLASLEGLNLRN